MPHENDKNTPLMQQYHDIKIEYPDALLLFQVGDFYELFFDDAKKAAAFLGIALTARGKNKGEPIPLCGVPVHALDHYSTKLIKGGFNVAICNQLERPRPGTVVKRGVTQVLTPGTLTDSKLLDEKSASYLFSLFPMQDSWGLLFGELLTAQLFATVLPAQSEKILESELIRFFPDEVIIPRNKQGQELQSYLKKLGYFTTAIDVDIAHEQTEINMWLQQQFKPHVVDTIQQQESLRLAMYYFYAYVRRNQASALGQFNHLQLYKADDFLLLDSATQRNLELTKNAQDGGHKNTLFAVIDGATTAMGSRMIKKWLLRPLVKQEAIMQRQEVITTCIDDIALTQQLEDRLKQIGDIERVVGRIALHRAHIHDFVLLIHALEILPTIVALLQPYTRIALCNIIVSHIADFSQLHGLLHAAINTDSSKDWIVQSGFDARLDELRELVENSNQKIIELEAREQQATGIGSLKIRYNQVHGYYIEVTKANTDLVPERYQRMQTLVGKERYLTQELQVLQGAILRARGEIESVEQEVFSRIKQEVLVYITPLRKLAHALAHLDALLGLSKVAYNNGYIRPVFNENRTILITNGRHPVVEQQQNSRFIPNDTVLDNNESLWIITGPNMGGKSTYLRQVALMSILAQIGSFVPADKAELSLLDRVFTRIGAGDNLAEGKSTFLVEMEETASICALATQHSLVILDEVGRGTSTFDGLAIAQSVVEFLYEQVGARCLFATHYHELTHLHERYPGIVSYYAASKKTNEGIVFLYKIIKGVADGSFGVEVAKLAQLPVAVIARAQQLVHQLNGSHSLPQAVRLVTPVAASAVIEDQKLAHLQQEMDALKQILGQKELLLQKLQSIDFNDLSPKKAFDVLWEFKELQG
jgi:DNA mismatch repair protein MutS